jgi:hypothetical protein
MDDQQQQVWEKLCSISETVATIKTNQETVAEDLKEHLIQDRQDKAFLTAAITSLQDTRTKTETKEGMWHKAGSIIMSGLAFLVSVLTAYRMH